MEVHPWWHDDTLIPLHKSLGIVGNGYAPFAAPDFIGSKWNVSIKEDPTLTKVPYLNSPPLRGLPVWFAPVADGLI